MVGCAVVVRFVEGWGCAAVMGMGVMVMGWPAAVARGAGVVMGWPAVMGLWVMGWAAVVRVSVGFMARRRR